jgi:eukaryotic-like serine/threonine-protein kinase
MDNTNAAENLAGIRLDSGWLVTERIEKPPGATGGFFSVCYRAEKDEEQCFLKAFDFAKFFNLANAQGQTASIVDVISEMINAYKYERDLSALCRTGRVTKVAFVRDSGEQMVSGYSIPIVPYLIFDTADGGDARSQLSFARKLESAWKLRSLHSVAVGLKQLHSIDVSHQDLKPSNVLIYNDESKIGDLGRSTCLALASPLRDCAFSGDISYAPPEILYGVHDPDWRKRSFATDCYLFGSLVVFYFSGMTMTALIRKNLPDDASWEWTHDSYDEVLAYVLDAFALALDEFSSCIEDAYLSAELRSMVSRLCHPIPSKRSFASGFDSGATSDLERVVSRLDYLHGKVKHTLST